MVRIPRAEQGVGLSGQAMPASTGDGYEAPGKALTQVGREISQFALTLQTQQDELADFEGRNKYQAFVNEVDKRRREADANVDGDGRGHTERLDNDSDTAYERFRAENSHLPPRTTRRLDLQYGNDRNRFSTRSFTAAQNRIGPYYDEQGNTWFNDNVVPRLFETDPETGQPTADRMTSVTRATAEIDRFLDGAPGMPPAVRDRLRQDLAKRVFQLWQHNAGPDATVDRERIIEGLRLEQDGVAPQDMYGEDARPAGRRSGAAERPATNSTDGDVELRPVPGGRQPRGARERRGQVEGIVLHHTSGTTLESALSQNQLAGTGYNYYVDRKGEVYQFAPDTQRMVHIRNMGDQHRNGQFPNLGLDNTVAISAIARNNADVTPEQREAIRKLTVQLARQHNIPRENIIGHGDIQSNRETDEGSMARDFREGRLALGGEPNRDGDRATRVADSGVIRNDAGPTVVAQNRTEDLVRRMIIDNQVDIERRAEVARRRLEIQERQEVTRQRVTVENDLITAYGIRVENLRRGEPPEANGGLTSQMLQNYNGVVRPTFRMTMERALNPVNNRQPISAPGIFSDFMRQVRANEHPPQVIIDMASDAFRNNQLNTADFNRVIALARRNVTPENRTPPFVSDQYRDIRRQLLPNVGRPTDAQSESYNTVLRKVDDYVSQQQAAGTLDARRLGEFTTGLVDNHRRESISGIMQEVNRLPRSRYLGVEPSAATMDHVAEASAKLRADVEAGRITPQQQANEIRMLQLLTQSLTMDHQRTNRGNSPPPPRVSSAPQPQGGQNSPSMPSPFDMYGPPRIESQQGGSLRQPQRYAPEPPPPAPFRESENVDDRRPGQGEFRGRTDDDLLTEYNRIGSRQRTEADKRRQGELLYELERRNMLQLRHPDESAPRRGDQGGREIVPLPR